MKLAETIFQESGPEKVDAENGILYGVKLIGHQSANGYEYTEACLKTATPLYEGVKSYVDHKGNGSERSIRDLTGEFRNPRYIDGKGIFADHHLLKSTDVFQGIIETAQRFPKMIGYSHVADGDRTRRNAKELVDSIKKVFSVDHVSDPATTGGMFESKGGSKGLPKSLGEFIEALPDSIPTTQRAKLIEAISDAWPMVGAATDPQQQITLALLNAVQELARSIMDANAQAAQTTAQAQADAAKTAAAEADAKAKAAQSQQQQTAPNAPTIESIQRKLDLMESENLLLKSGRASADEKVRALQIETLADSKADKRTALLESWPKISDQKTIRESRAFERPGQSPPANGDGKAADAGQKAYESRFEESSKAARERNAKRGTFV